MSTAITGKDVVSIGTIPRLSDFADGDVGVLEFEGDLFDATVGHDSAIFSEMATGKAATLTLRLVAGSANDTYLFGEMNRFKLDSPSYVLLNAEITQRVGDGLGKITHVIYLLSKGAIKKVPTHTTSTEGNTAAGIHEWTIWFARGDVSVE